MTNMPMQELRKYWKDSMFLVGKNKVMQVSLGKDKESTFMNNTYLLSRHLRGNSGLFFSNEGPDYILDYFKNYSCPYFGSSGTIANETLIIERGSDMLKDFPSSMESQFRQLGVSLKLDKGHFVVLSDFTLCTKGNPLSADQAQMIKHLGIKMDEFRIDIKGYWQKSTGDFKDLAPGEGDDVDVDEE